MIDPNAPGAYLRNGKWVIDGISEIEPDFEDLPLEEEVDHNPPDADVTVVWTFQNGIYRTETWLDGILIDTDYHTNHIDLRMRVREDAAWYCPMPGDSCKEEHLGLSF